MVIMKTKVFYGVEYRSGNNGQTFDIFSSLKEAKLFSKNIIKYTNIPEPKTPK